MAFHTDWFSGNIPVWSKLLKKYKNKPNLRFLEIGCYEGRATLWLLKNILTAASSKIIVIDTFKGNKEHSKEMVKNLYNDFKENVSEYLSADPEKTKVIIHKGFSQEIIRNFGSKSRFDFIYIDGSHVAKDVLEDTILCWRLLKKNGVMIFDDYTVVDYRDPLLRPDLAIDAFLRVFHGQYKILNLGYQIAIKKEGDNLPIPLNFQPITEPKDLLPGFDKINELKIIVVKLSSDLKRIQSAKFYKLWQKYCQIRDTILNSLRS